MIDFLLTIFFLILPLVLLVVVGLFRWLASLIGGSRTEVGSSES
jgi:hypothetical protein